MRVLVIGGTLFIGRALVKALLKAKHQVTVLHRKQEHDLGRRVSNLVADRNDPAQLKKALDGQEFDVVFDNVYDWARGTTAEQVEAMVELLPNVSRYVFMSSVAAYGEGIDHFETDPLAPDDHPDSYVRNKARTERMLFERHTKRGFPAVTLRPPYIFGPENPFYREAFVWDRVIAKRHIILPGDGSRLMQFVYVKDLVEVCVQVMTHPGAVGQAFNVCNPRPVTQLHLLRMLAKAAGKPLQMVPVPRKRIEESGADPKSPPYYFGQYWDLPPITMRTQKARRVLAFRATPMPQALKETYRWYARNRSDKEPDFSFEDKLIEG
jgi:2'-hydroxyisoflavone reductase